MLHNIYRFPVNYVLPTGYSIFRFRPLINRSSQQLNLLCIICDNLDHSHQPCVETIMPQTIQPLQRLRQITIWRQQSTDETVQTPRPAQIIVHRIQTPCTPQQCNEVWMQMVISKALRSHVRPH
jgi:hypothetical protein